MRLRSIGLIGTSTANDTASGQDPPLLDFPRDPVNMRHIPIANIAHLSNLSPLTYLQTTKLFFGRSRRRALTMKLVKSSLYCCLFLSAIVSDTAFSRDVSVIAIDYPPFTTPERSDDGTVFVLLRNWFGDRNLEIKITPEFLPPARAQNRIIQGDWCASLFPPRDDIKATFLPINDTTIKIGFLRLKEPSEFQWESLDYFKDKHIAALRNTTREGLFKPFLDAGAVLTGIETIEQGVQLLLKKRVDYAFADKTTLDTIDLTPADRKKLEFSKTLLGSYQFGVYLSPECQDAFNPQ